MTVDQNVFSEHVNIVLQLEGKNILKLALMRSNPAMFNVLQLFTFIALVGLSSPVNPFE